MTLEARHDTYLEVVARDLAAAARRQARIRLRRQGRMRVAALSVTAVILLTGSAVAGSALLGMPAPRIVQTTLDSLWPRDGAVDLAPVRGTARAVARFDGLTLYRSPSRRAGAVCLSIVPAGGVRLAEGGGISCWVRKPQQAWPIGVVSRVMGDRQLVFGQLRRPEGATLVLQWRGAETVRIPIGVDGYFLGAVALASAKPGARPLLGTLRLIDGDGFVISSREMIRLAAD